MSYLPVVASFEFNVSFANDCANDITQWGLPGKVMQGSTCLEVCILNNGNWT